MINDRFELFVKRSLISRSEGKEVDIIAVIAICVWVSISLPPPTSPAFDYFGFGEGEAHLGGNVESGRSE